MKFGLFKDYGALNSKPVFAAFEQSLTSRGHTVCDNDLNSDVAVIWSVLWNGRMLGNKAVWQHYRQQNKPVIVLEVGAINRGKTWRVGLNGINRSSYTTLVDADNTRATQLGLKLKPWRTNGEYILICGQHDRSLQWQDQPSMSTWFLQTYDELRRHTDRPIVFRPHPRCRLPHIEVGLKKVYRQDPTLISGTYDDFDLSFNNIWATVSYSSNPGTNSIVNGVPAFVGTKSLAYPVANDIDFLHTIENPLMPDRTQWLNNYAWCEYTVEEIAQGIPLDLLTTLL